MVHEGHTRTAAAAVVGVNRHGVGVWVGAVARSGERVLVSGRTGRRPDEQKALSPEQEIRIKRLIETVAQINKACRLRCGRASRSAC